MSTPSTPSAAPRERLAWLAAVTAERAVTAEEIAAYRRVVQPGPAGRDPVGGTPVVASPVHPFVLAWEALRDAVVVVTGSGTGEPPPVVHLSQEIRQSRPVRAGERVTIELDVLGARRDPRGVRLALRVVLAEADGPPFAELSTALLLVGATAPAPFGSVPPLAGTGTPAWTTAVSWAVPHDLPRRYAEVSGDDNPIHLDRDRAVAAGYPDVIAHGMSMLAMVSEQVVGRHAAGDASRVRAVGGRFSTPVVPGELLDLLLHAEADGRRVLFCCKTPRGLAVKNGWVELG